MSELEKAPSRPPVRIESDAMTALSELSLSLDSLCNDADSISDRLEREIPQAIKEGEALLEELSLLEGSFKKSSAKP